MSKDEDAGRDLPDNLANSLSTAVSVGGCPQDVYVGVDVFGRGCLGGGGWNTLEAVAKARSYNLSVAIFAPGWTWELATSPRDFPEREERFWSLLLPQLATHGPLLPHTEGQIFSSEFSLGQVGCEAGWQCLANMHFQSNLLPGSKLVNHQGKDCLRLTAGSSDGCSIPLFLLSIILDDCQQTFFQILTWNLEGSLGVTHLTLGLKGGDQLVIPYNEKKRAEVEAEGWEGPALQGWQTITFQPSPEISGLVHFLGLRVQGEVFLAKLEIHKLGAV